MKRKLLFISFMICTMVAMSQVTLQNPKPTNNNLASVYFIDATTGFMVGELGTIIKTTNGGATWSTIISGTTQWLYSVFFVNSNVGFVAGSGGTILKTVNGGTSWTKLTSGTPYELSAIHFMDMNIGFVAGEHDLIKTTDGGTTWKSVSGGMKEISFIDENKIIELVPDEINLYENIMKTTNGGSTWVQIAGSGGYHITGICFVDASIGYHVGDNGRIFKTTNGGMSWTQLTSNTNGYLYKPFFVDKNIGYVLPNLKTTDGGLTWQKFTTPIVGGEMNSLFFADANHGYVVGNNYPIGSLALKTNDGGLTWSDLSNHLTQDLFSVHFPSKLVGYTVGDKGAILKTEDGGSNWNKLSIKSKALFNSVFFTDNLTGFIVGECDTIFKTSNGGSTWIPTKLKNVYNLNSVYFKTKDIGFVVGTGGCIFKTIDGGQNWIDHSISFSFSLASVYFNDINTGFAIGNDYYDGSMIMKTSDGGITWDYVWTSNDISNEYNLKSIRFVNDKAGYAFTGRKSDWYGNQTGVLKTSDGGLTWQFYWIGEGPYLGNMFFTDVNTGYIVGEYGSCYKTLDGWGYNLIKLNSGTSQDFTDIFFIDANTGFAVGYAGTIVKLTSGFPLGIREDKALESKVKLYPNPAKDLFTIYINGNKSKESKVSIFNLNGEQVMQDKFQDQIEININTFIKGVYFVKIQSNERIETKKLVIQ